VGGRAVTSRDRQGKGPPGTAQATGTGALPDRSSGGWRRKRDEDQTCNAMNKRP